MNGDSDGSEYVDNSEHESVGHTARGRSAKASKASLKNAGAKREMSRGSNVALEDLHDASENAKNRDASVERIQNNVLRSYRDLLNSVITEVHEPIESAGSDVLQPSQIGISFWTAKEKQKLFAAIQSHGPGDLAALAVAIGTKAEAEISAYILLLQEGVRELDESATQQFGPADVSAAIEIQPESLHAEELLAEAIELKARATEEAREQKRWGGSSWLIDEDAAAAMNERFGNPNIEAAGSSEVKNSFAKTTNIIIDDEESDNRSPSSDELLNASMFLTLSRSIFMNCKDPEMNWQSIFGNEEDVSRPSIRRTAFDDFYNLVVSFTRRLMQASIFQAMSRLRASTDPRLRPNVNGFDVAAARDTIGIQAQRSEYWAAAVKRCGVEVYSDSKKYRTEGRQGTKIGFRLSEKETKAELGILLPDAAAHAHDMTGAEDDDSDAESINSDAYTVVSSSDHSAGDSSDDEPAVDTKGRPFKDRRRALSPASFHRAETKYLDQLDGYRGGALNDEHRQALGLSTKTERRMREPSFPYKQVDPDTRPIDWRAVTQYEAPWEQPHGTPQQAEFDSVEIEGARRRKRRRLAAGRHGDADVGSESRSEGDINEGGESENAVNVESSSENSEDSGSDDGKNGESDESDSESDIE